MSTLNDKLNLMPIGVKTTGAAALGGALGYTLSPLAASLLSRLVMFNNPATARLLGDQARTKNIGMLLGAGLGAWLGGGTHLNFSGWGDFLRSASRTGNSLFTPENARKAVQKAKRSADNLQYQSGLEKEHSEKEAFDRMDNKYTSDIIPIGSSMQLIEQDRFLDPMSKSKTSMLIYGAENKERGMTSPKQLTASAISAGADFGTAYLFGKGVGSILGLPPPVTKRISMVGGVAAAVRSSGILNQAFK